MSSVKEQIVPLVVPLPLNIASLPVAWMAATIAEGAAIPSIATSWSARLASTFVIPDYASQLLFPRPNSQMLVVLTPEVV
jgi:hypothetical protein